MDIHRLNCEFSNWIFRFANFMIERAALKNFQYCLGFSSAKRFPMWSCYKHLSWQFSNLIYEVRVFPATCLACGMKYSEPLQHVRVTAPPRQVLDLLPKELTSFVRPTSRCKTWDLAKDGV